VKKRRNGNCLLASSAMVAMAASDAFAQSPATLPGVDKGWLQWVVGLGLAVVILLAAFLNPKRSHLT
jgi:hypothetical protein